MARVPWAKTSRSCSEGGLKDSACADRRARLPWQVFAELMVRALRPLAELKRQPETFYRGWRLVALDGTQFSLSNTPANNAARRKAKSRRGRSAFAKFWGGSRLVKVPVRVKGRPREVSHYLELREIWVRVGRAGHRSQTLRLWTTLLDPNQAPAAELVSPRQLLARAGRSKRYPSRQ